MYLSLGYINKCVDAYASGVVMDVIHLAFTKAFDSVPLRRLACKTEAYGVQGRLLEWTKCYLMGRSQVLSVEGNQSREAELLSGLLQVSVLGPILFLIYVNALPEGLQVGRYLFADEMKTLHKVETMSGAMCLQEAQYVLQEWIDTWLLKCNTDKCGVLSIKKLEDIL